MCTCTCVFAVLLHTFTRTHGSVHPCTVQYHSPSLCDAPVTSHMSVQQQIQHTNYHEYKQYTFCGIHTPTRELTHCFCLVH